MLIAADGETIMIDQMVRRRRPSRNTSRFCVSGYCAGSSAVVAVSKLRQGLGKDAIITMTSNGRVIGYAAGEVLLKMAGSIGTVPLIQDLWIMQVQLWLGQRSNV